MMSPVFLPVSIDVPKPSLLSVTSFMAMSKLEYSTQCLFRFSSKKLPETGKGKGLSGTLRLKGIRIGEGDRG